VLAGVDAASTFCYLLAAEERRDADTWGVHLLDAAKQGLRPDYTIADAGQGLRAGQKAAWNDTLHAGRWAERSLSRRRCASGCQPQFRPAATPTPSMISRPATARQVIPLPSASPQALDAPHLDRLALLRCCRHELVHQPLGMDPT